MTKSKNLSLLEAARMARDALYLRRNQGKSQTYNDMAEQAIAALNAAIAAAEKEQPKILTEDQKDAARYRWIKDTVWPPNVESVITMHKNALWDEVIDRDMEAALKGPK